MERDAVLITHGHSDHWLGLARLLERFPDARGLATAKVLVGAPDTPDTIEQSRRYIQDFSRVVDSEEKAEDIYTMMMGLHGER